MSNKIAVMNFYLRIRIFSLYLVMSVNQLHADDLSIQKRGQIADVGIYGVVDGEDFLGVILSCDNVVAKYSDFIKSKVLINKMYKFLAFNKVRDPITRKVSLSSLIRVVELIDPLATKAASEFRYPDNEIQPNDKRIITAYDDGSFKLKKEEIENRRKALELHYPITSDSHIRELFFKEGSIWVWDFHLSPQFDEIVRIEASTLENKMKEIN